jgi:hypothetical protein
MLSHPKKITKTVILFYFWGFAIELDGDKWGITPMANDG